MPFVRHKMFAYITQGDRLLVFRHPYAPEAGIQVPAGTVEAGEPFADAVMREAVEETGLRELALVAYLGDHIRAMCDVGRDEVHHRHFYHLHYTGNVPDTWRHVEHDPSDVLSALPVFEFFWVRLPRDIPPLIADHDALLPVLCERLFSNQPAEHRQSPSVEPRHSQQT